MRSCGRSSTASFPTIFFSWRASRLDSMGAAPIVAKATMRFSCIRGPFIVITRAGRLLFGNVERIQHQVIGVDQQNLLVIDDALLVIGRRRKLTLAGQGQR